MKNAKLGTALPDRWLARLRERADLHSLGPVVAAFLLGALVIGWPWLSGRVTIPWDAKATFLPQIQFLAQSLDEGHPLPPHPHRLSRVERQSRSVG